MKLYRHASRGSALLISMIILILVTLLTTVFLELIWGSAQTVRGIESSNVAYYQAIGIIEEGLIDPAVNRKTPWNISEKAENFTYTGRLLDVSTGSTVMPASGRGNSPYDDNYNIIALGEPVQIVIPPGVNWTNVAFEFRIPKIGNSGTGVAGSMSNSGVILWTFGYSGASLYASGETNIFQGADLDGIPTSIASLEGNTNSGSIKQFELFYTDPEFLGSNGAKCTDYACTLKLSMIRPIQTADGRSLSFLEYRIDFNSVSVPSQFMTLDATAYSYGFQRTHSVRIPQITTNTALDFAVLQ